MAALLLPEGETEQLYRDEMNRHNAVNVT